MLICVVSQVRCICYKQTGSSLHHLGFQGYLEYCKCFIIYFVNQLLSEPDKQNVPVLFRRQLILCFCSCSCATVMIWIMPKLILLLLKQFYIIFMCLIFTHSRCTEVSCYHWSVNLISLSTKLKFTKILHTKKRFYTKDNNTTVSQEVQFVSERKICNSKRWPQLSISKNENILVEVSIPSDNNFV